MMRRKFTFAIILTSFLAFSQTTTGNLITLNGDMTVKLDTNSTTATITLTGPSNFWLGIGFDGTSMGSVSDMFIWNSTSNLDYTPSGGYSAPSADAVQDWTLISDTVSGTTRTVVAERPLVSSGNFTITNDATPIQIIANRGLSTNIGYHGSNGFRTITTITRSVLGTDETSVKEPNLLLFPNPTNDFFEIKSDQKIKSIIVFDATGKKVKTFASTLEKYDVSNLKKGVYFLEIINNEGDSQYEKLLKN